MSISYSLAEMRKNSKTELDDLRIQAEKLTKSFAKDDRYWQITKDAHGNGSAVIRFLPRGPGEENEYVRIFSYGFTGPTGQWYIADSRQSIAPEGQDDPVARLRNKLFRSALDEDKELASKLKRRLQFVSNILVVRDKANPEAEGKVFLFKYGQKIFERLDSLTKPQFEDKAAVNPFSLDKGVNFRIRVKKNAGGFFSYDDSEFDAPSPIAKTDAEIERIWKSCYSLKELLEEKNFKSYEELDQRLHQVLGLDNDPFLTKGSMPAPRQREIPAASHAEETSPPWPEMGEDSDDLAKFRMMLDKE